MKYLLSYFFLFLFFISCESEPKSIFDFETTDEIVGFLWKNACKEPPFYKEGYTHFIAKDITIHIYPSCHSCYIGCKGKINEVDITNIETTDSLRKFLQIAYDNNGLDPRYPKSQKKTTPVINTNLSPFEIKQKVFQLFEAIEKINVNRSEPIYEEWVRLKCEHKER